jgi:hypothetical protein
MIAQVAPPSQAVTSLDRNSFVTGLQPTDRGLARAQSMSTFCPWLMTRFILRRLMLSGAGVERKRADPRTTGVGSLKSSDLCGLAVDDLFDLAAVHVEFTGYRSLAAALGVPASDRLFQRRHRRWHRRFGLVGRRCGVVRCGIVATHGACSLVSPDEQHEQFETAD